MKIIVVLIVFLFSIYAQGNSQHILKCDLTTGYVCPDSETYKKNKKIYSDAELMTALGYSIDEKGCWIFTSSRRHNSYFKSNSIEGRKKTLKKWYAKLRKSFHTTLTEKI